jgi:hypothetical protein
MRFRKELAGVGGRSLDWRALVFMAGGADSLALAAVWDLVFNAGGEDKVVEGGGDCNG